MMQRLEATGIAVELAGGSPIVGGVGNSTFDLIPFDRPANFYMWNSMGMASSIGLGLALARPDLRVVVGWRSENPVFDSYRLDRFHRSGVTLQVHDSAASR